MFSPNFQKLLKPIFDLIRKGRHFIWTKVNQEAFEEFEARQLKHLVLHISDNKGRLQLFSDTSKIVAGSALCQFQTATTKCIGYVSERLPPAAVNYSRWN